MASKTAVAVPLQKKYGFARFWSRFKRCWRLHLMVIIPVVYLLIFNYAPMLGLQIAFREFKMFPGGKPWDFVWSSPWVGLANFVKFFGGNDWAMVVGNTVSISLYSIAVGFPIPVILALFIHVNQREGLKKLTQNVSYIPHFISTVVMVGILNQVLNPTTGMIAAIAKLFDTTVTTDIRANEGSFYHLYVWSGVWQNMGWSAILYVSALSAVSEELHEAAKIDGASRFRRVLSVDLPAIMPTIAIQFILRTSTIMTVGYEKALLLQNQFNINKSEMISTYVYKYGMDGFANYGYGTAINMMNSVINTGMLLLVNWVTNALTDNEMGLF